MNNFSSDPSVKALWRFEASPGFLVDSIAALTLANNGSVAQDTTYYDEGVAAAKFTKTTNENLQLADASLPTGFPLKSGDTTKQGTWCFRFRPTNISTDYISPGLSKWDYNGNLISLSTEIVGGKLRIVWGYGSSGHTLEFFDTLALTLNHWYAAIVCFDGVNKILKVYVYDETAGGIVNYYSFTPTNTLRIVNAPLQIGGEVGGTSCSGQIDEVVVFNRMINASEALEICHQSYNGTISVPTTIEDALNNPTGLSFTLNTAGGGSGAIGTDYAHDNIASEELYSTSQNQSCYVTTTVTGPGTILFWWAIAGQTTTLEFQIDGAQQDLIGNLSSPYAPTIWAQKTYSIPAGSHTLKWLFNRGAFGVGTYTASWFDQVVWNQTPLIEPLGIPSEEAFGNPVLLQGLSPCRSLSRCQDLPAPLAPCRSLTTVAAIQAPHLASCRSLTTCGALGLNHLAVVRSLTRTQNIPLKNGEGLFSIY